MVSRGHKATGGIGPELCSGQMVTDVALLSKVRVEQFHGIEIEEFPAEIARVAMWLMDHIENVELSHTFGRSFTRLPFTGGANIGHGNALQIDWKSVLPPDQCTCVMGNPPFVGKQYMSASQKEDLKHVWQNAPGVGVLDFVTGWHATAADYMKGTPHIRCAFVSTNSICQGEQASLLWGKILTPYGYKIHFAHRTFTWESEARGKANVHCVIVGFGNTEPWNGQPKRLYDYDNDPLNPLVTMPANISPYLVEANDSVATPRSRPLCNVPENEQLDRTVDRCYRTAPFEADRDRVEFLFALYEQLAAPPASKKKPTRKARAKS